MGACGARRLPKGHQHEDDRMNGMNGWRVHKLRNAPYHASDLCSMHVLYKYITYTRRTCALLVKLFGHMQSKEYFKSHKSTFSF